MSVPPLLGTYGPPAVQKGDVVRCLFRCCDCTVTSVSDAPFPWPRVRGKKRRGGSGLWVNATLARAIRTESAEALKHWFGASSTTVWAWRRAFRVGGTATTPGSKKAHLAGSRAGAETLKAKEWTDEELDAKAEAAKKCGTRPGPRWAPERGGWTPEQIALLGTHYDAVIAARLGRTAVAVTVKRNKLKIPAFSGGSAGGPAWTPDQVALLGTDHDAAIAERIGRTTGAVTQKRAELEIPVFLGWTAGGAAWTPEQEVLLGTDHDEVIAGRIDRTVGAVTQRRVSLGIPVFRDRRRKPPDDTAPGKE